MPLYEYECQACGERFELIQKFSDGPPDACPKCAKGPVHRQVSSPAFQFKGSGWYITDYARKGSKPEGESTKGESTKSDTTAESPSDSSTDSKKGDKTTASPAPAPASKPSST